MISRSQRLVSLWFVHQCSALPRRFLARNGIHPIPTTQRGLDKPGTIAAISIVSAVSLNCIS